MAESRVKLKINEVLDNIPEDILEDVLDYLKSLMNKSKTNIILSKNIKKILEEDKNLLERLAQ